FFGRSSTTKELVADMSDDEIWGLKRGGYDYKKVYAAYKAATEYKGKAKVILAHTIKGYDLGASCDGRNATHQMKELSIEDIKIFGDRHRIPVSDEEIEKDVHAMPYYHPGPDAPEIKYMQERRKQLGGYVPERRKKYH